MFGGASAPSDKQVVTMDAMAQVDGMEWLIVVCVGLDSAKQAAGTSDMEFADTRSKLYRGITRAHMMVLAVNEYISDGWLAFLTTVRLAEDRQFDSNKTLEAAEQDRKLSQQKTAERMAAAAKHNDELNAQAEEAVAAMQKTRGGDEDAFLKREVLRLLQRGIELDRAATQAEDMWQLQTQTDAFMESYAAEFSLADDERIFVRKRILSQRALTVAAAASARRTWRHEQMVKEVPDAVAAAASREGVTGRHSHKSIEAAAIAKLSPDNTVDAVVKTALDEWGKMQTLWLQVVSQAKVTG
jgi:hypothetical protein